MALRNFIFVFICFAFSLAACSYPKHFTQDFYAQNEQALEAIKNIYTGLYKEHPFFLLFEEKSFTKISFEFIEDTIKYIYHFDLNKPQPFIDSLKAHNYEAPKIKNLVDDMRAIQCTWISTIKYYEDLQPRSLVQMAVRNKALNSRIKGETYCILVFFEKPQPFNEKGIFLDRSDKKRRRQINGSTLRRVNDKVGYAFTKHYR